jgi:hypothetical protein
LHGIDLTALKYAALAHDLGERAMKRNYLLQPGALSWEDTLDLWRHPILGEQAASELKLPRQTQLLIRWHHEWWNGGGYPDGLAGEAIPPGARILRAVDSYFALTSDRPHRRRFDRTDAEQIIADLAGIEFDPLVVKLLLQVLAEEASESTIAYLATGGAEAVTRSIEDQPQPPDEVVYASAYAKQQAEVPAETLNSNQSAAPDFASSEALDETWIEGQMGMAGPDLASSEAIDEAGIESRTEMAAMGFASSEAPGAARVESQPEIADADFVSSEALAVAPYNAGVESQPEIASADFASSGAPVAPEVEDQTEIAGAETHITQEKLES